VHASIWRFSGGPDELLRRYEAMVAEIPGENMRLHLCLRDDDGIVLVDTCPSKEVFSNFLAGEGFRSLCDRHGSRSRRRPKICLSAPRTSTASGGSSDARSGRSCIRPTDVQRAPRPRASVLKAQLAPTALAELRAGKREAAAKMPMELVRR
jgi:hypothetical protein